MHIAHMQDFIADTGPAPQAHGAFDLFQGMKQALGTTTARVSVMQGNSDKAWTAAIAATLAPGDTVILLDTMVEACTWAQDAGLRVEVITLQSSGPLGTLEALSRRLGKDVDDSVKAVFVHQSAATDLAGVRRVLDENFHDALLCLDARELNQTAEIEMDRNEVDVTVAPCPVDATSAERLVLLALSPKARPALHVIAA
ncbi:MAG: hypothetical protein AAGP08_17435 [Pseudomonadota bacterium]